MKKTSLVTLSAATTFGIILGCYLKRHQQTEGQTCLAHCHYKITNQDPVYLRETLTNGQGL